MECSSSSSSSSTITSLSLSPPTPDGTHNLNMAPPHQQNKECVSVTVRFRPLSLREIQKGDEVAWYADGDVVVRSEYNPATAYAFDRVFGPATTTRGVYDVAAKNVVRGAMEGINGTVFAYGVTSSGKTYTMHGDPKSPGIIPLAVKDIFNIIQDTPDREYLLRVSYLEIYNEVINDLLDPAGQNLRIREDAQGTYVEGIKEEVVLSPAHALSMIAAGEELRHVGSNNYNLISSRSHTVFTLTVESSPRSSDEYDDDYEVTISQLNLIDLAGSESSKTETTGQRRKEGSYINKSLLTLGTVIGKLSEGKASHVPYRDSKLTRLLQSSLCGHGRVSLICTLTPASSNMEETHNTLKFAHRAKHVTIQAIANRIVDEKSLIKKYQREILSLKQELDQLKRGMFEQTHILGTPQEDHLFMRQQLEAGQVKLLSRLEEEEQAKAALLGRIQRLTKLILVSSQNNTKSLEPELLGHRRRHSFGEEKKCESLDGTFSMNGFCAPAQLESRTSLNAGEGHHKAEGPHRKVYLPQQTKEAMTIHMDLLQEQLKMLAGEAASCTIFLMSLSEQAVTNSGDMQLQVEMEKTKARIEEKEGQIQALEQQIIETALVALKNASPVEMSEAISNLIMQLNKKTYELEIKAVDIKFLQEQVQAKASEIKKLEETATAGAFWQNDLLFEDSRNQKAFDVQPPRSIFINNAVLNGSQHPGGLINSSSLVGDFKGRGLEAELSDSESYSSKGSFSNAGKSLNLHSQLLMQADEIESLKQDRIQLQEQNDGLRIQSQKLAEEASYAKQLASSAAIELRNLAQEVTRLSFQNSKLVNELSLAQEDRSSKKSGTLSGMDGSFRNIHRNGHIHKMNQAEAARRKDDGSESDVDDIESYTLDPEDIKRELYARKEKEMVLESALANKEEVETELRKKLEEGKKREADLENDLAGMWVQLAMLKKEKGMKNSLEIDCSSTETYDSVRRKDAEDEPEPETSPPKEKEQLAIKELQGCLKDEKQKTAELRILLAQLKSEELEGLQLSVLEELQKVHMEALTKLFQAKAKTQDKESEHDRWSHADQQDNDRNNHVCKICFESPTAAVLLPCRHFCLCKPCAVACTECPLCRRGIADRIITFTS